MILLWTRIYFENIYICFFLLTFSFANTFFLMKKKCLSKLTNVLRRTFHKYVPISYEQKSYNFVLFVHSLSPIWDFFFYHVETLLFYATYSRSKGLHIKLTTPITRISRNFSKVISRRLVTFTSVLGEGIVTTNATYLRFDSVPGLRIKPGPLECKASALTNRYGSH